MAKTHYPDDIREEPDGTHTAVRGCNWAIGREPLNSEVFQKGHDQPTCKNCQKWFSAFIAYKEDGD